MSKSGFEAGGNIGRVAEVIADEGPMTREELFAALQASGLTEYQAHSGLRELFKVHKACYMIHLTADGREALRLMEERRDFGPGGVYSQVPPAPLQGGPRLEARCGD